MKNGQPFRFQLDLSTGVPGFDLTNRQKVELLAFLKSLTDHEVLTDPRFGDPWEER